MEQSVTVRLALAQNMIYFLIRESRHRISVLMNIFRIFGHRVQIKQHFETTAHINCFLMITCIIFNLPKCCTACYLRHLTKAVCQGGEPRNKHLSKLKMIDVSIGEQLFCTIVNEAVGNVINSKLCDSSLVIYQFPFF